MNVALRAHDHPAHTIFVETHDHLAHTIFVETLQWPFIHRGRSLILFETQRGGRAVDKRPEATVDNKDHWVTRNLVG